MRLAPSPAPSPPAETVDLFDPRLYSDGDPHNCWRRLRQDDPVRWQPVPGRGGFWSVTRYADAQRVMLDYHTFSSTGGVFLNLLGRREPASGQQFASTDPPRHGRIRGPVQRRLTPVAVAEHVKSLRADIGTMLDAGESFDLTAALRPLPVAILGPLLGIPAEDWPNLARLVMMSVAEEDPGVMLPGGPEETLEAAHRELFGYLIDLVMRHRRQPRGDLIDVLGETVVDGDVLRPGAVVANAYSIVLGAAAAIPHVPAAAVLALAADGRYAECAGRPDRIPLLVEEALRWSTPAQHFMRVTTRPAEISGVRIGRGEAVVVWLGSANRDPEAFVDPDEFRPDREPNRHLAFGAGRHFCIGNNIARLALRLVFEEIFARYEDVRPVAEPTHVRSNWLAGFTSVPVAGVPRRRPV